ncbi:MAG: hypothetical protein LBL80_02730 [Ruminococcus sp.]|jgi:hypothetical protein|nr:hypothetical protein [Ruminococcus sp.]
MKIQKILSAFLASVLMLSLFGCRNEVAAVSPENSSDSAVGFISSQLEKNKTRLYVYNDFADGRNYYTQKAFMGDNYYAGNIPPMNEAAEGAYSGKTCISASIDLNKEPWGGYMFINGVLKAGETVPEADFGDDPEAKVDLSGASRFVFYAKGETGREEVEFLIGGLGNDGKPYPDSTKYSMGYINLKKDWTKYEIDVSKLNMSEIGCGFAWVTNDTQNSPATDITFYLDEMYYEFDNKPMFIKSYAAREVDDTDDWVINNFAYVYDNAAALIALSNAGEYDKAKQIADAIVYASENDRYYTDGRLRNAYANGDPQTYSGWHSVITEEMSQNSGFWDASQGAWFEDFYAVSTSTGNIAWAILALNEAHRSFPDGDKYLETAKRLGDFVLTLKSDTGGFTGGFEGWEGQEVAVTYKSTEHNIDLITAFAELAEITGDDRYKIASEHAKDFVMSMYDPDLHLFYTGTTTDGVTPNKDVLPLDCNTWAILALGDSFKDGKSVLTEVEKQFAVGGGYDFNTDKDGVWFEGTAQVALAYKSIGDEAKYNEILSFLNENASENGSITAADRDYVTTGFTVSGMGDMPWKYGKREHLGATAWLAFAELGVNPLGM